MNRPMIGRIAGFLFVFYVVAFVAFCGYVFFTFSATTWLPGFRFTVTLMRGFTLFMDYLLPVHVAAVAVAASLAGTAQTVGARRETPPTFGRLVSSTLVLFLVLTAAYTFLAEGVYPGAVRRVADLTYQSRLGRVYKSQAEKALLANDHVAALDAIDRYLVVDPGNTQIAALRPLEAQRAAQQALPKPAAPPVPAVDPTDSAQALFEKAQLAFNRKDWFTANFFAQQAVTVDPRRRDAQELAARAWDNLSGLVASTDATRADLFRQKKDAFALLTTNPVAAYYRFRDLAVKYPNDKDIATYAAQAAADIRASTFFVDEASRLEPLPGTQAILFFNRRTTAATEAVYVGKVVELADGSAFFYDVEAISYDSSGKVAWHFNAPYGKRLAGATSAAGSAGQSIVLMHAVDRNDAKVQYLPVYLQGARPAAEKDTLLLTPTMEELRALSLSGDTLSTMNITSLLRLRNDLGAFGLPRPALTIAMAMKLVMPFIYLILSMFAVALGWGFRARDGGRLPAVGIILIPVIPVVCAVLTLLYVHAHRVVAGFAVLAFGLPVALVILGVLQLLLLAGALVLLAGQTTR